jgi:hypothetical protein
LTSITPLEAAPPPKFLPIKFLVPSLFFLIRGLNDARFWFDDFAGSGTALNPEPSRHLAILGTMYTLNRGTLKLTAQLPPLDLTDSPNLILETRQEGNWETIGSAPVDTTDNLSSYNATFRILDWDDTRDTEFRTTVTIDSSPYSWTGTIRKNPVEKQSISLGRDHLPTHHLTEKSKITASTGPPSAFGSPILSPFNHIAKHDPDVFLALGDQIYEGQPTPEDSGTNFNRHHDYLYKWYLWVLQAREIIRDRPYCLYP